MDDSVLLSIDQGTTSSRAILFSRAGEILDVNQKELTLYYPEKGWVEQDPEEIWADTLWACRESVKKAQGQKIAAIGITNQRETTILWDRKTGKAVYNAIVWQDRRTSEFCRKLKEQGHEKSISEKTGLLLDPYFSATKIAWILDHVEGAREKAEKGELAFGTVDCFLLWRLTGGKCHASDATNASRTLLYNIRTGEWDEALLKLFNIPRALLPEVKDNCADFGVSDRSVLGQEIPIGGMAGDQHAALVGQGCFKEAMVKSTYGTGCFALMNIGSDFKLSRNRLLTTIGYRLDGRATYAIEGAIFIAGAAIQWLRDNLGLIKSAAESEKLAVSVPDSNGVYFVPAFTGMGAPYWKPEAQAAILGLSRESNAAHIVRAALEAQAYQTLDLMEAFVADSGFDPDIIRVDGGLVSNAFVCQFLADMLHRTVEVPKSLESTALGAAYLAGLHAGVYSSLEDISENRQVAHRYTPQMGDIERRNLYEGWRQAVRKVLS